MSFSGNILRASKIKSYVPDFPKTRVPYKKKIIDLFIDFILRWSEKKQ